jgi:hypothetical protein
MRKFLVKKGETTEEVARRAQEICLQLDRAEAAMLDAENALLDYIPQLEGFGASLHYGRSVLIKLKFALGPKSQQTEVIK